MNLRIASFVLLFGLALSLGLNLVNINRPPFDGHNFRQCQTLWTIETFAHEGIDLLKPKTNYVGQVGVLVLETPIYQAMAAYVYRISGGSLVWVRFLNIVISLATAGLLYFTARRFMSASAALTTSGFFLAAPLQITYMSSFLLDPLGTFLALAAFTLLHRWLYPSAVVGEKGCFSGSLLLFALTAILVALIKPLYLFPAVILSLFSLAEDLTQKNWPWRKVMILAITTTPALTAIILWQHHASLVNAQSGYALSPMAHLGQGKLLSGVWYNDVGRRILWSGPGGAGLLAAFGWAVSAFLYYRRGRELRELILPVVTFGSVFGYHFVFADIVFPHDYYTIVTLPFICMAAAFTIETVLPNWPPLSRSKLYLNSPRLVLTVVILGCLGICGLGVVVKKRFVIIQSMVKLRELGRGHFEKGAPAMIFISPDLSPGGLPPHEAPAALYALGLVGRAIIVQDGAQTLEQYPSQRALVPTPKYFVFFGLQPPQGIIPAGAEPIISDAEGRLWAWRTK